MTQDTSPIRQRVHQQAGRDDDGLGPHTDIGSRLRALYGAVQDEGVPPELLDLLERLDSAEEAQRAKSGSKGGE